MKKLSKKKGELKVGVKKNPSTSAQPNKEKTFDYGGLPDRDLKKNLGC